ncbi:hypothetical protein [Legionella rowbothamii]|uniref:hypothetical protein n=1 Tax=Legionella rowbothamii TaxID=96229 RepID=UPI00105588AE|nr:hypothetical protein [Legionella rowbothamii]
MEALKQVEELVSTRINLVKTIFSVMRLEARLAGLTVFPLVLNICLLLIVLMTFWIGISLLLGYEFFVLSNNFLLSVVLVVLFNLGVLLALAKYLTFNLKNMSFEKTRSYFSQNKSMDDEQFEETVTSANNRDGQEGTSATGIGGAE